MTIAMFPPTVTVTVKGLPGLNGAAGTITNADDFFQTLNKFSELDTEQKKADARTNLGVQVFDCGEFF